MFKAECKENGRWVDCKDRQTGKVMTGKTRRGLKRLLRQKQGVGSSPTGFSFPHRTVAVS